MRPQFSDRAVGNVEIGVRVEVDQPDALVAGQVARDGSDPDRAVATEHQRDLVLGYRVADSASGVLHTLT